MTHNQYKHLPFAVALWGLLLGMVVWVGCSKDDDPRPVEPPGRIVLVYMGGDNNLSSETYQKMEALRQGWNSSFDGELFVYNDPSDAAPSLYRIEEVKGVAELVVVSDYPEENSANSTVFSRVINEVVNMHPAKSYGLLVFSHASGWLPQQTLVRPRSVVIDGTDEMELVDLAAAVPRGVFDFIVFEACFMAGIEVAYELKDKTEWIVASSAEIVSPGFTPVYGDILKCLFRPTADLKGMIQTVFNHYQAEAGYRRSATFSLIHTPALTALGQWIRSRTLPVGIYPVEVSGDTPSVDLYDIQHFDRYSYRLFFDFEDYYSRLLTAEADRNELSALVSAAVPYKVATPSFMPDQGGFAIHQHSGLTTYIPQERFPYLNKEYKKLRWYKETGISND